MKKPKGIRFSIELNENIPIKFSTCKDDCKRSRYHSFDTFEEAKRVLIERQRARIEAEQEFLSEIMSLKETDTYASWPTKRVGNDFVPASARFLCGCQTTLEQARWLEAFHEENAPDYDDRDDSVKGLP